MDDADAVDAVDAAEYRRSYAAAVEEAEAAGAAAREGLDPARRAAEPAELLAVLQDTAAEPDARRAALAALAEQSFLVREFRPHQSSFVAALRAVAADPDPELREQALDLLALRKDEYAQRLLVAGLRDAEEALVPEGRALQMVGYDLHAEHYELLREIAASAERRAIRTDALRLLAADAGSKDIFERILHDRSESAEARATSAIALNSLAPDEFPGMVEEIVLDDTDDDEVRATCLTALSHGPGPAGGLDLARRVLESPAPKSAQLTRAAHEYERVVAPATSGGGSGG